MSSPRSGKQNSEWSWLNGWMAAKSWETSNDSRKGSSELKSLDERSVKSCSFSTEHDSVKIRKNLVSTRVSTKPYMSSPLTHSSSTNPCSGSVFDDTASSTNSSSSTSETRGSSKSGSNEGSVSKPSYMSLTESIKAKRRSHGRKPSPLSKGITARRSDTDLYSAELGKDLYPPMFIDRFEEVRSRRG